MFCRRVTTRNAAVLVYEVPDNAYERAEMWRKSRFPIGGTNTINKPDNENASIFPPRATCLNNLRVRNNVVGPERGPRRAHHERQTVPKRKHIYIYTRAYGNKRARS